MNSINPQYSSLILWVFIALGVNSALNGWMIHSEKGRYFHYVVLFRVLGSITLMIPCIFFLNLNYVIIKENQIIITIFISLVLSLLCIFFNARRKRSSKDRNNYAYLFHDSSNLNFSFYEIITWIIYLLPYELLLRGLLLPHYLIRYNLIIAVLVNSGLYAFSHIQQGKREATGAFIFGLILCLLTLISGNFWSAFLIHLVLALSNSFITRGNGQLNEIKI
ncbi:MAG TPA: CPBP family intramembrane glutamic endopeptidase [Cyclobacteriaceae bacterium]